MLNERILRRLLKMREDTEQEAMEDYARAVIAVEQCRQQLQQVEVFRNNYARELSEKSTGSRIRMTVFGSYQSFLEKLDGIITRQERALERLRQSASQKRLVYFEKRKQRKIIDSLLEQFLKRQALAEARQEQKLNDDLNSSKYARSRMEREYV